MILKKCILFSSIIFLTTLDALTLKDALHTAYDINPEIIEKEKRYKEINYDVNMAMSGYLPKINLVGSVPIEDSRTNNFNDNKYDIEASLTQNLFNGFGDFNKYRIESAKYKSAFYSIKELKNKFSLEVISAYLNLLKEKDIQNIQKSSVENHENIFNKTKMKYDAGLGNRLEYRLSVTSLYLAKINYLEHKNVIKQAKITLEKYLNREIEINDLVYSKDEIKIPESFDEMLEISINKHPSMLVAKSNKQMSEYELKYAQKDLYPTLDFKANYYSGEDGVYKKLFDEYYEASFVLSYRIFNGGSDWNAKKKQQYNMQQKNAIVEKVKRDIVHKIKSKYDKYLILKEKEKLLDNYVALKSLTLESYYDEFSTGKATLRDILDTTESLYAVKKMQTNNKYDLLQSKYAVLEAMGQLSENNQVNKE